MEISQTMQGAREEEKRGERQQKPCAVSFQVGLSNLNIWRGADSGRRETGPDRETSRGGLSCSPKPTVYLKAEDSDPPPTLPSYGPLPYRTQKPECECAHPGQRVEGGLFSRKPKTVASVWGTLQSRVCPGVPHLLLQTRLNIRQEGWSESSQRELRPGGGRPLLSWPAGPSRGAPPEISF